MSGFFFNSDIFNSKWLKINISDKLKLKIAVIIIIVSFSKSDILNSKCQIITLLLSFVKYFPEQLLRTFEVLVDQIKVMF